MSFFPHKPEDICPGLAFLERGSRTLDRQLMTICQQLNAGRFDDGIPPRPSPDGEYDESRIPTDWCHTRMDQNIDAIAPWWND